jgi:hypothetical protein
MPVLHQRCGGQRKGWTDGSFRCCEQPVFWGIFVVACVRVQHNVLVCRTMLRAPTRQYGGPKGEDYPLELPFRECQLAVDARKECGVAVNEKFTGSD